MNCNEIKDMLSSYIDGELDEKDMLLVEEHIHNCEECRRELEEYNKILHVLHHMPEEEPPKGYCNRLHEKLIKANVNKKTSKRMRWVKYGSIAAAFILVFVVYATSNRGLNIGYRMGAAKSENKAAYESAQSMEQPAEAPSAPETYGYDDYKEDDYNIATEESEKSGTNAGMSITDRVELTTITGSGVDEREAKIIKSGDINVKTENYNQFISGLTEKVKVFGGFIVTIASYISKTLLDLSLYVISKQIPGLT
jgi:hypothetical protein